MGDTNTKKKHRFFRLKPEETIDYKQVDVLLSFLTEHGKIKPRRVTRLTLKQQRQLSRAVKRARFLDLLPFVTCVEK